MKFESLSEMLDHFETISEFRGYIEHCLCDAQKKLSDAEYVNHVYIDRDLLVGGFPLYLIDAFIEGLLHEKSHQNK